MTEIIIFKNADGTCGVITPAKDVKDAIKDVPKGLEYRIADSSIIPKDRTFRNAWTDDYEGAQVDVDMSKAKDIHMEKIREKRNEKLAELDIETMKGFDVQSQKQSLRDIPSTFNLDGAKNVDELIGLWPESLKDGA